MAEKRAATGVAGAASEAVGAAKRANTPATAAAEEQAEVAAALAQVWAGALQERRADLATRPVAAAAR